MKIIKLILSLSFLLLVSSVFGQKLKVKENHGEVFRPKSVNYLDVFESPEGGYFSVSYVPARRVLLIIPLKAKYYIQQFDDDMNFQREIMLNLESKGEKFKFYDLVQFGGRFYMFTTKADEQRGKLDLYYAELDVESGQVTGDYTAVVSAEYVPQNGYTYPSFKISISENKEFLVVFSKNSQKVAKRSLFGRNRTTDDDDVGTYKFKFTFWLFDSNMREVMHEKDYVLKLENSTNEFYVQDFEVDDKGSIYILGKNAITDQLTRRERKDAKRRSWLDIKQSAFVLEKINPDGSSEQQVTPEELLYLDMDILFDKEGNINLIGLVGEQVYYKLAATGVNRLILTAEDLNVISEQTTNFTEEVLENVNNVLVVQNSLSDRKKKRVKRKEERLSDEQKAYNEISKRAAINVNTIAYSGLDEYGNASVVLEEYYVQVVTHTSTNANGGTTTTTTYYYHYDDLFMLKFFDDEVVQNSYKKSYTLVNASLDVSLNVVEQDGELTIMTPGEVVRVDTELDRVVDYKLKAYDRSVRVPGLRKKTFFYKKVIDENTILAPAQFRNKVAWYKFKVN
tara:strand:- start:1936 stop:3633 length:1698 start_codon:yes stop_codon:yes gene_type:complete